MIIIIIIITSSVAIKKLKRLSHDRLGHCFTSRCGHNSGTFTLLRICRRSIKELLFSTQLTAAVETK